MDDPYSLVRFVEAQDPVWDQVLKELRASRKNSHWMWFIFPQIEGLGSSSMARKYAIGSRAEAEAYLAHPVLGPRLLEATRIVSESPASSAEEIFGAIDTMKLRSSMTLFAQIEGYAEEFNSVLKKYFAGKSDSFTVNRLYGR